MLFDGVTHPSSLCRLLDSGRGIEGVGLENPPTQAQDISGIPPLAGKQR